MDSVPTRPPIRYARSGDVSIAFQVIGEDSSIDLVWAPGTVSHLALDSERRAALNRRVSSFCRLIRFDKRGTGMSDRVTNAATLEERTDDIRAVMDAAGSKAAVILGASEGGSMACMFAAQYPDRTRGLIVWGCQSTWIKSAGHPWGYERKEYDHMVQMLRDTWPSREYVRTWGAGLGSAAPEEMVDEFLNVFQMAASPAAIVALEEMNGQIDLRDILPSIRIPTLVMGRRGDPIASVEAIEDLAHRIPGARLALFPGASHQMVGPGLDPEPIYATIEEFVTGSAPASRADRFLATMLVLDIVGSTESVAQVGDATWRALLDEHYRVARRELERHRGVEVDTAGDGLLATFEGPAGAIRCAGAIQRADRAIGLSSRAGVHCGEVERSGLAIRGIAVHIAARLAALASANEIVISGTVCDLAAGSGLRFEDRGMHELKGVPDSRRVFAVVD
jgi:pimeloyl-ACP methyl ester carboxylesterase/class 3 adenylate cyclase